VSAPDDKATIDFIFRPSEAARAIAAPPGIPDDRTAALRQGFDSTMKDPAFMADATKLKFEIEPSTGQEVDELFKQIYKTPAATVNRAMTIMGIK